MCNAFCISQVALYSTYFLQSFAVCMYPCFASEISVLLYIVPLSYRTFQRVFNAFFCGQQFLHQSHMHHFEMKFVVINSNCVKHLL